MAKIGSSAVVPDRDEIANKVQIPINPSPQTIAKHINEVNDHIKGRITSWINQVLNIQLTPDSLFDQLQSGTILYKILHKIDPNASLSQITEHAQPGSIRARHNITAFLQYIKNDLNSDKIRQFEPDQFIERTDHEPLIDCVLDLIDYASIEKGFPCLSIDANVLIERERYRSHYSGLSLPRSKTSSIVDVSKSNHRPSSVAAYSKSSRPPSAPQHNYLIGGVSQNQQTSKISRILPPLVENDIDAGSELVSSTDNVITMLGTISEQTSPNVSVLQNPQLIMSLKKSDKFAPPGISDILRQFYGTLASFPEQNRLQSMCELVMQNSSNYYEEIAQEEANFKPVTAIQIVVNHKGEAPDDDFRILENNDRPVDLNRSISNRQLYLAVSRNDNQSPITDIQLQEADQESMPPYGFNKILRSVSGLPGNLKFGTGRAGLYLCYKHGPAAPIIDLQISDDPQPGYRTLPQRLQYFGYNHDYGQLLYAKPIYRRCRKRKRDGQRPETRSLS